MTEDTTKVTEGQDLNGDKDVYTREEVEALKKELSGNHEKGVQKLINEKKAFDEVFNHLADVKEDPKSLISLYEDKPEVAKIILDKYYEGKSIESFKQDINYKPDYTDPDVLDRLLEQKAQEKIEAKLIKDKKEAFVKHLKLTDEEVEQFNDAFEDRKALKSFNLEKIDSVLERTYRDIDADAQALKDYKETIKQAGIMGTTKGNAPGNSTAKPKTSLDKNREGVAALLKKAKRR